MRYLLPAISTQSRDGGILDALPHLILVGVGLKPGFKANRAWQDFTGCHYRPDAEGGWLECIHPEDRNTILGFCEKARQLEFADTLECRIRDRAGQYKWFVVKAGAFSSNHPSGDFFLSFTEMDERIASHQQLQAKVDVQTSMLNASVDCIKLIQKDGALRQMNRSGCLALGVPTDEADFGMPWLERLPQEVRKQGRRALKDAGRGKNARFAGMSVLPGEKPVYWDNILTPMKDMQGETAAILCVSRDVTLQRVAERRLRYASEVDGLTGLWNRNVFRKRVQRAIAKARQSNGRIGLLLIDLDHFKHINDTLGHPAGDHLLRTLAKRLKACVHKEAFVARLGGDEFAIGVPDLVHEDALCAVAKKALLQAVAPISFGGKLINGGMSIGCAVYPRDAEDYSGLMKSADTALNHLKSSGGRGGLQVFSSEMTAQALSAATQIRTAREIISEDIIVPFYQPKVRLDNWRVHGFEALLRWPREDGTLGLPDCVLEAFGDYDLATGMADAMHGKVFADMARWLRGGVQPAPVSINASPVEFYRDDYAERILGKLERFQVPPELVEIEITEHMLIERGAEFTGRALRVMKKAGVRIALDDFGTGHSSFRHLMDFPVDALKIDRTFVRGMMDDPHIMAIIQAVCLLGSQLSLDVVAEGVESEAGAAALRRAGCGFGQGFHFGAAVPAEQAVGLIGDHDRYVPAARAGSPA